MTGLYYTRRHEWVRFFGSTASVGVTGKSLKGDVVYIELPEPGMRVRRGEPCAKVESAKAEMAVCSPVSGVIAEVNDTVYDDPDMIARNPLDVWLLRVDIENEADIGGLLTKAEYEQI